MWCVVEVIGSGSKLKSNGCAPVSDVLMLDRSISSLDVGLMYPAIARAGCNPSAHVSRMMLCAIFLLIFLHLNVWSPQQSCF